MFWNRKRKIREAERARIHRHSEEITKAASEAEVLARNDPVAAVQVLSVALRRVALALTQT